MINHNFPDNIRHDHGGLNIYSDSASEKRSKLKHNYKPSCFIHGVRSVNVTHDNRYLIITYISHYGYIRVIDLEKLELLPFRYTGHKHSVRMVTVTKDNKYFFSAAWDGMYRKNCLLSDECAQVLGMTGRSPSIYLSPDDKYLLTASYDHEICLGTNNTGRRWDLSSGEVVTFYRHYKPRKDPECIDIACDREYIYSGSDDGVCIKWDTLSGTPLLTYFECDANIRKIAISEHLIAAAATDGYLRVHNKASGEPYRYLFHSNNEAMDVRISKDESRLWSGSMDGSIKCFNLITGETLYHKQIHNHWIWSLCLTKSDTVIISGSSEGKIAFISADNGEILSKLHCFPVENELLFECPPDKAFPNGSFYTSNRDFIEVVLEDKEKGEGEVLALKDHRRISYINRLNLKNIVITRLTNNRQYTAMTGKYITDRKLLNQAETHKLPRRLKS